jgi:hypothetical protein
MSLGNFLLCGIIIRRRAGVNRKRSTVDLRRYRSIIMPAMDGGSI